jgi:hypothetical protein
MPPLFKPDSIICQTNADSKIRICLLTPIFVAVKFLFYIISVQNESGLSIQNDSGTHPASSGAKKIAEYWNNVSF